MYIWGNWTATPSMRLNIPIHEHNIINIIRAIPKGSCDPTNMNPTSGFGNG